MGVPFVFPKTINLKELSEGGEGGGGLQSLYTAKSLEAERGKNGIVRFGSNGVAEATRRKNPALEAKSIVLSYLERRCLIVLFSLYRRKRKA